MPRFGSGIPFVPPASRRSRFARGDALILLRPQQIHFCPTLVHAGEAVYPRITLSANNIHFSNRQYPVQRELDAGGTRCATRRSRGRREPAGWILRQSGRR